MLDNGSATATFYVEAPGSATAEIFIDDVFFGVDDEKAGKPYAPQVAPENIDGSVGTPFEVSTGVYEIRDLTLSFKAGRDTRELEEEEEPYEVNPDIDHHLVYLQSALPDDPNLLLIDYPLPQESLDDPNQSLVLADAGIALRQGTTYQWQVEMVMKDPNDVPYPAGSPNNILGSVWSFTTANAVPAITSITDHMLLVDGGTEFTITTTPVANNYRWFKVVGDVDTAENEETDDVMLMDAGIYSGTTTQTLVVTGAAPDGSDDARVYAVAYNGVPDEIGTEVSAPSAARWFWAPRLVNLYAFDEAYEETYEVEVEVEEGVFETQERTRMVTPDAISGYDMRLLSNDTGPDVPTLVANLPPADGIDGNAYSLLFNNPRANPADPNNGDAQFAEVPEKWAGIYKDITISAWVYNNGGSAWNRIFDYGRSNNNYIMLCINPGTTINNAVRMSVNRNGTEQSVTTPANAMPVGQWTHVVATRTGTTGRIYINGELVVTSNSISNRPVDYQPSDPPRNWLGRSQWGSGDGYFNGQIDQLKVYNYALTTVEAGQDYLADSLKEYVCNRQIYDLGTYDVNGNCLIDLEDFAALAARWLEDDRIYPAE